MKKIFYSFLFFVGCISSFLFILYVIGFFLYLVHSDQSVVPSIAFVPKEIFLLSPLILFYRKKEVIELLEKFL